MQAMQARASRDWLSWTVACVALSLSSVASAGTGVWTTGGPYGEVVYALAIDPTTPAALYAGTVGGGVFKSTNSGGTWAAINTGLTNEYVLALAINPTTPATLYAGTWGGGVFKSADSGGTWAAVNTGLTYPSVDALAIDPTNPATLYAATDGEGVFKSTNSGGTWAAVNAGLTSLDVRALAINPMTPATLYAGTHDAGVFKSTNSGGTWAAVNTGLTSLVVNALAINLTNPATLYAGTDDGGVSKSTNSGGTWAAANTGLTNLCVIALAIHPTTPDTLYAGTGGGGVFKSTNSGGTWTAVNTGLANLIVLALAMNTSTPATLYAGTYGAVWQLTPPIGVDADLTLTLSDSPDPVTGTTPLTYTIAVSNTGPDTASSLSVTHTLPAGVAFDSAVGSGWTCGESGGVVSCTRPILAVGAAPNITVQMTPGPVTTVLVSSASVSAAEADPNLANNADSETTTVNAPLVWMGTRTKTVLADGGEFVTNGDVTYTITLTNAGVAAQADNPGHELVDTLPSTLDLVSASATSGAVVSNLPSNTVTWDGSLPSGGSVTVTIRATIQPTVALGTTIANQATVSYDADGNGTNDATTLTDDPDEPGANDSTSFVVVSPTMDFYSLEPCRLLDTRNALGTFGGPALAAGADRVFPLFGRCGIPSTARALSVNLTVTQPTAQGNLRLYPAGTPLPLVSSINYVAGQTRANNAIAPLNGLGELAVRCTQAAGTAHFILDVNGYFE
jgi:uncharacterized repeat protein (TIGR01451 family)